MCVSSDIFTKPLTTVAFRRIRDRILPNDRQDRGAVPRLAKPRGAPSSWDGYLFPYIGLRTKT